MTQAMSLNLRSFNLSDVKIQNFINLIKEKSNWEFLTTFFNTPPQKKRNYHPAHNPVDGDTKYLYPWIDHEKKYFQRA